VARVASRKLSRCYQACVIPCIAQPITLPNDRAKFANCDHRIESIAVSQCLVQHHGVSPGISIIISLFVSLLRLAKAVLHKAATFGNYSVTRLRVYKIIPSESQPRRTPSDVRAIPLSLLPPSLPLFFSHLRPPAVCTRRNAG